ncbi:unnamed protein product [Lampetra planeri]
MSNSTSNVSGDAAASSSHVPLQATYALLCVCGVAANGAVICALACGGGGSKRRHVSDAYVLNLAVADLLFLLGMPFLAHQLVSEQRWRFGWFLCKALTLVDVNNQYTSVGTVTVLCIDRYIAVAHPLTAATNRTMRGAFLVNALVWLCSLLLSLPAPVYASVLRIHGVEVCALDFPEARLGATAFAVANFALAFAAPLALISVFYALALRRVSSATRRATLRPQSSRSRRATRTAVAIVVAFAACWAPFHTLQMVGLTLSEPTDGFHLAYQLSICLGYAHSCINPVLLIFFTEFFKERLPCARIRATSGDVGTMPGKGRERQSAWCSDINAAGDDGGGDDEEVAAATVMTTTSAAAAAPMGEGSDTRVQEQLHGEDFTSTSLSVSLVEAAPAMPTPRCEFVRRMTIDEASVLICGSAALLVSAGNAFDGAETPHRNTAG